MTTYINLLPWEYRLRKLALARIRQWSLVWGLTVVCLAALWWQRRDDHQAAVGNAQSLKQRYAAVKRLQTETLRLKTQLSDLQRQESLTSKLRNQGRGLTLVGLVSASAGRCAGRIRVQHFIYDDNRPLLDAAPAATPTATTSTTAAPTADPTSARLLSLKGTAADNLAVAEFVVGLRDAGTFDRVELKSAAEGTASRSKTIAYCLECGF